MQRPSKCLSDPLTWRFMSRRHIWWKGPGATCKQKCRRFERNAFIIVSCLAEAGAEDRRARLEHVAAVVVLRIAGGGVGLVDLAVTVDRPVGGHGVDVVVVGAVGELHIVEGLVVVRSEETGRLGVVAAGEGDLADVVVGVAGDLDAVVGGEDGPVVAALNLDDDVAVERGVDLLPRQLLALAIDLDLNIPFYDYRLYNA